MMKRRIQLALLALLCGCAFFLPAPQAQQNKSSQAAKKIDDAALRNAEANASDWITHGRNYAETRFSPLKQINADNIKSLGLAWTFDTETTRGLEATPIVVDGVIYTTGSWSIVYALDARTGRLLWKYDPKVSGAYGQRACCDVVNRGVAVYKGRVYVGALDGRLIALDAATGKLIWSVVTVDQSQPYTITGAPRVVKGKVLIGNGGAEFGVRGYISAYDVETGKIAWRFYTVPGDPSKPFESPALERAAKTWNGEWWKIGGGGTVWDSMAYDPELDLLYVGTGNGSPWNQNLRSPGGGDNLYLSSILALKPDTGELVWHYQTTPGESWDFTATQHIILADLDINGRKRKVLMQAPKNGFFYVIDRATGELLSADAYVPMTWATGVDKKTGRPIERPEARYKEALTILKPGPMGGHNWQPMSFNPQTGLVYIPAQDPFFAYAGVKNFQYRPGAWNTGSDFSQLKAAPPIVPTGHLLAWDPVAQKERWRVPYKTIWNGGTLTSAGNLVFQGTADGRFVAYSADKGEKLWEVTVGTGIIAAPVTYEVDGVQYVSVMAGWGGAAALVGGVESGRANGAGMLLTFALNAKQTMPDFFSRKLEPVTSIEFTTATEKIDAGAGLYAQWCATCHGLVGISGGATPDLRYSAASVYDHYKEILLEGKNLARGMPSFKEWLTVDDVEAIRAYLLKRRADLTKRP
ncbi:MAG: PQQ-dependent dehydrogenase, methanol/ethanol family [Blastocatellia bacterium]